MNGGKILGIIILIAIILSIAVVGYDTLKTDVDADENIVQTVETLNESELNQTFTQDDNQSIQTVNINIDQKIGSTRIEFADNSSTIYNITSNNEENTTTQVTANQNNSHLDVNIESEKAQNTIVLSNKYNYSINGEIVTGGFSLDLEDNAMIDELNMSIVAGGVDIALNGGSLNTLNSEITTGGLTITGEPAGQTMVNSQIEVGGINVQLEKAVADIFTDIEVGGLNPGDYQKIGDNEYKGNLFDSSENKLIINSTIQLGGVNSQSF